MKLGLERYLKENLEECPTFEEEPAVSQCRGSVPSAPETGTGHCKALPGTSQVDFLVRDHYVGFLLYTPGQLCLLCVVS